MKFMAQEDKELLLRDLCARDGGVEILVDGEIQESIKFAHI